MSDYLEPLYGEPRARFERIREIIGALAPEVEEGFKYGMPLYAADGRVIIYVAVWKSHIGLYPVYEGSESFEAAIAPLRSGKDTVKLMHKAPLPEEIVRLIVADKLASRS